MNALAVIPVIVPILVGALCLAGRGVIWRRSLCTAAAVAQVGIAVWLVVLTSGGDRLVMGPGGWSVPLGIVLVVDGLAALMLALSACTALACLLYGFGEMPARFEHPLRLPLWQFLIAGVNLAFVTGDLFNLFVAFELMLIASYALLTLESDDWDVKQAFPYIAMNLLGGLLFLVAIGVAYAVYGTLNFAQMAQIGMATGSQPQIVLVALLLFAVFALKAGIFPLYFWLPGSYPILAAPLAAFFAGMLTKVGVYTLIRVYGTVMPQDLHGLYAMMGWLGAATMVLAVLGAVSRGFIRGILSWHILSQIGYMVVALAIFTPLAIAGCIYYLVHHIIVKATLFLAGAAAAQARGGSDDLNHPGGIAHTRPLLAACFLIQAMSLAGLPPLSGFWGKYIIIAEGLRTTHYIWVAAAVVAGILTLFSMLKIWNAVFWGEPQSAAKTGSQASEGAATPSRPLAQAAIVGLTILSLCIGLGAGFFLDLAEQAATQAFDQAGYIHAVLAESAVLTDTATGAP